MKASSLDSLIRRRRMVRNYEERPVARELLERVLDQARRAPSAGHTQGVSFVALCDGARRAQVAELAGEAAYVRRGYPAWLSRAPVHVIPCVEPAVYHARYASDDKKSARSSRDWPLPYWHVDLGAAFMLLLLAAVDHGLVAGFQGIHNLAGLEALLGIPKGVAALGVVTLGYPAPDRRSPSLERGWKSLEDVVHWEGW